MKKFFTKTLILASVLVTVMVSTAFAYEAPIEIGTAVVIKTTYSGIPVGTILPIYSVSVEGEDLRYRTFFDGKFGYVRGTYVEFTPHNFVVSYEGVNGEPFDCLTGGTKISRCQNCSYVFYEDFFPGEHHLCYSFGMSSNCEDDVINRTYCEFCDWEEIEVIPAPGHDLETTYQGLPGQVFNCENGGMKVSRCKRELCTYEHRELIPPGHELYEISRIDPTRHSSGTSTMECSRCGAREYITIPALPDYGMTDDFFFTGSNVSRWRLEIVRDLRPRFQLHLWRYAAWCCIS